MTHRKSLTSYLGRFGAMFAILGTIIVVLLVARLLGLL